MPFDTLKLARDFEVAGAWRRPSRLGPPRHWQMG